MEKNFDERFKPLLEHFAEQVGYSLNPLPG